MESDNFTEHYIIKLLSLSYPPSPKEKRGRCGSPKCFTSARNKDTFEAEQERKREKLAVAEWL